MMGWQLIETGLLLGLYSLLAGAYALLYAVAQLQARPLFGRAATIVFILHFLVGVGVIVFEPLGLAWKLFLALSSIAVYAIPHITWRYLESSHASEV